MKIKQTVSIILLCVMLALLLCSCKGSSYPITINGTDVGKDIYNYYLCVAENDAKYKNETNKESVAENLCKEYVAANELFEKHGVTLSAEDKVSVSVKLKNNWWLYKDFYTKNNVSKQTLCLVLEYEKLLDNLVIKLFGEGGAQALADEEVKKYFKENFIAVKLITADFIDEKGKPLEEDKINEITDKFTEMRNTIRVGGDMASAAELYPELVEYDDSVNVIRSYDSAFPEGLFDLVFTMENGSSQVFRYDRGIYLIQKADSEDVINGYYEIYKNECVLKIKKETIENTINTIAQNYEIVYNK